MEAFILKHQDKITGTLYCPDRLIFKGHLPFNYAQGMENFLQGKGVLLKDLPSFGGEQIQRLKDHAEKLLGEPIPFLRRKARKDDLARQRARDEGITEGLAAVFSCMETCPTFSLRYGKGRPRLRRDFRRCLVLYFYFLDPEFGLLHVRVCTWFPLTVQVYVNGHEWLARQLTKERIPFQQCDNAFLSIGDVARAQKLADRLMKKKWNGFLNVLAKRCNPLLGDLLQGLAYRWVTDQAEFSLDILFKDADAQAHLYKRLLEHATLQLGGENLLSYFGRQRPALCRGEVVTDLKHTHKGVRVKHAYQGNWIKMYDKFAQILRIEVVVNRASAFRVRRWGARKGQRVFDWFPLLKSVAFLGRTADVARQTARRYLGGLAVVDDPKVSQDLLDRACNPAPFAGRKRRALNPLGREDQRLFFAVLRGEHALRGFRSRDLASYLNHLPSKDPDVRRRQSAQRSRLLQLLRAHGLIAKLPRTRRYRVTEHGFAFMSTAIHLRYKAFPADMADVG